MEIIALSGMDIFKLLPRTNCKDCGSPSCLAFAMKIAAKKAELSQCPHLSPESEAKLRELMEPAAKSVNLEKKDKKIVLGGEKVLFRHDESFYNPTAFGIEIPFGLSLQELQKTLKEIEEISIERVGEILSLDFIALVQGDEREEDFIDYVETIDKLSRYPLAVKIKSDSAAASLSEKIDGGGLLIYLNNHSSIDKDLITKLSKCALALPVSDKNEAEKAGILFNEAGIKRGIAAIEAPNNAEKLDLLTTIRHQALKAKNRNFSFPTLIWNQQQDDEMSNVVLSVLKYGSAVVFSSIDKESLLPLLVLRQNIFSDPRRPIQVEAKVYPIGDVSKNSPILVTTNFSLTYFTVAQEIEASRIPSYLLVIDTDGTSVLTAWASDRFGADRIIAGAEQGGLSALVSHNSLILPGYVPSLAKEIESRSPWKVILGPREAQGIPKMLRSL